MDSQRLHLRSTVFVAQALLDQFPPVSPEFELEATDEARIVANTIIVSGGTLRGYHLRLVAESITAADAQASVEVGLVNQTAPDLVNGRAGHPLTVVAERLAGGRGTSKGQKGGKGPKGRDGIEMPPIPQPEPQPNDPNPGPPPQIGRDGEDGGIGLKGGDGGLVTLVLMEPSTNATGWFGAGGDGGEGGDGGIGENVGGPSPGSTDGDAGEEGPEGPPGDDKPATVNIVDLAGYRQGIANARALAEWIRFRQQLAIEEFHRGNLVVALDERDAAQRLTASDMPPSLADELPVLVRDNRSITGVPRDHDLVPDIEHWACTYHNAAEALRMELTDGDGSVLTGEPSDRFNRVRAALGTLIRAGGQLTVQDNDLETRSRDTLSTVVDLGARTESTLTRLDVVLNTPGINPAITVADDAPMDMDARTVAKALADVLGSGDPSAVVAPPKDTVLLPEPPTGPPFRPEQDPVTLLPADLELLVHRTVRDRRIVTPSDAAAIASRAAGLARLADWTQVAVGAVDEDGVPVAVHLGRVATDLRSATGDRGVLDLLIELAELSHVWRLGRARMEQILAGAKTVAQQRAIAAALTTAVPPAVPGPADLLPGLRCLLDALSWHEQNADRAADILTFGLTRAPAAEIVRYPFRPGLDGDLSGLAPLIHAPDWELDLRDATPGHLQPQDLQRVIDAVTELDHATLYADYVDRGIAIVGEAPPPVVREFHKADQPDLFARFASGAGNFWFDVTLDDLAGDQGTIPHRETRVVGIKITLEFEASAPANDVTLLATHTGLSVQRDLDGVEHRQQMLPVKVEVTLSVPTNGEAEADRMLVGQRLVEGSNKIAFAAYGRGAAAGWLIAKADNTVVLEGLQTIRVEVLYEGIVPAGTVSLRLVASAPTALQVGAEWPIRVRLTAPTGPDGASVFLTSSDPAVIRTPSAIVVPAGQLEAVGLATVVGATGGLPPTISARTADGVTREFRPIVPVPPRPLTASVRLAADRPGSVAAVGVLPVAPGQPGQLLASFAPPREEPGVAERPSILHHRGADLRPVRNAEVGHQPRSLAVDATRKRIYVANGGDRSRSVSMLDATTLRTLAETKVGQITDVEVDAAAGLVYVARFPSDIVVLSADDLSVVTEFTDPDGRLRRPHGLAIVPEASGGATIYAARTARGVPDEESAVTQLLRQPDGSHTLERSLRFADIGTQPVDVAVDAENDMVFVACLGGGGVPPLLIVLEHPTMTELGRVPLFSPGRAVATHPGSGLAYIVGEAGLMIVDGASATMVSRVKLGGFPMSVAVDPETGTTYVGRRDDATVVRIDAPRRAAPGFW